jgi:preprotein translocase subunit YajC
VQPSEDGPVLREQTGPPIGFWMILIFIALMWFMIFLPQRREKKRHATMLAQLKKGDRIQTIGGVLGTVVELRDREVIVKVDEANNTRMRFTRGAIQGVVEEAKE